MKQQRNISLYPFRNAAPMSLIFIIFTLLGISSIVAEEPFYYIGENDSLVVENVIFTSTSGDISLDAYKNYSSEYYDEQILSLSLRVITNKLSYEISYYDIMCDDVNGDYESFNERGLSGLIGIDRSFIPSRAYFRLRGFGLIGPSVIKVPILEDVYEEIDYDWTLGVTAKAGISFGLGAFLIPLEIKGTAHQYGVSYGASSGFGFKF